MFNIAGVLGIPIPDISVLDIGAMVEGTPRYASLVEQGLASVVGVEPQPEQRARLEREAPASHRYLPHVLGRGGPGRLHLTRYPGCTSLYEPDPAVIDLFSTIGAAAPEGNFFVTGTEEVTTTRLDDALNELDPDFVPDFVKLDVQGAELDVLLGGAETIPEALVLETEAEFVCLYKDQPLFGDIQILLREQGFVLHKLIDVGGRGFRPLWLEDNPFAPLSQLLWADAIFVRDFARLDEYADEELLKAAVIVHELYRSVDLAAYYLGALDRRGTSDHQARYLDALRAEPELPLMFMNIREGA